MLLLLCVIGFEPMDYALKHGMWLVKLIWLLCSLILLTSLLWIGNKLLPINTKWFNRLGLVIGIIIDAHNDGVLL